MTRSTPIRSDAANYPAMAAVMITALMLSAAMVGGGVPRLVPVEAMQAVLGTGRSVSPAVVVESSVRASPTAGIEPRNAGPLPADVPGALGRFVASGPSGPGHGALPPPAG